MIQMYMYMYISTFSSAPVAINSGDSGVIQVIS